MISLFRYLEDESEGSTCDLLGEALAPSESPSSWSTIASPRFTTYQRLPRCWKPDDPEGRILTGKAYQQQSDLDYELELFGINSPSHHVETHSAYYQVEEEPRPPAFAGFTGGSFYQVDALGKKPVYSSPDQPAKPVYVDPSRDYNPVEILEKADFATPNLVPFVRGKRLNFRVVFNR